MLKRLAVILMCLLPLRVPGQDTDLEKAIRLFDEGDEKQSEQLFRAVLKTDPSNPLAAYYLGRVCFNLKKYDESIDWFEKATKAEPRNSDYHMWLGRGYAREAQQASIFRKPSLAGKSKSAMLKAVELDPQNVQARLDLMEFYRQAPGIAGGSTEKALEQAHEIRKLDTYQGHLAVGRMNESMKDTSAAIEEYKQAMKSFPDSTAPCYRLGTLYTARGNYAEAFDLYSQAMADRPGEIRAHYQFGRVAALSGERLDEGEMALKRYLDYTPREPDAWLAVAHWRLGMIYERKGDKDLARKEYEKGIAFDPERKEIKEALKKIK